MRGNVYNDSVNDEEYVARVRRHKPSALLPLVAATSAKYWKGDSWVKSPYKKFTPWALADIARVSLISGNEHRADATPDDLLKCAAAYVSVNDPQLSGSDPGSFANFLLRITAEQLPFQHYRPRNELGRSAALFEQTQPSKPLKVIQPGWDVELFGCTLSEYVGAGFLVQAMAIANGGRFSADWFLESEPNGITKVIKPALIADIVNQNFVASAESYKAQRAKMRADAYRRFTFNPLLAKPAVSGILDDELLVPVVSLLFRKLSPLGIYYAGGEQFGNAFTEDVGDLFEQYVGRNLNTIPDVQVHPEIIYGKDSKRSVDWMVVSEDAVILIEVKSARPSEAVRLGADEAREHLRRMLGRAYEQVNNTDGLIESGHSAFKAIPSALPRYGLIVTMEPFPVANTPLFDDLHAAPNIPTRVCSVDELEALVCLEGQTVSALLSKFMNDPSKDGWSLHQALVESELSRNAVIEEAWKGFAWGPPIPPEN